MSLDKLVDSTQLDNDLTSVADAIRSKGGTSASLAFPSGFVNAINAISGGGDNSFVKTSYTLVSQTTWNSMMTSVSLSPRTLNEVVIWNVRGTNVQTSGTVTGKMGITVTQNGKVVSNANGRKQANSVSAPDSLQAPSGWQTASALTVDTSTGKYKGPSSNPFTIAKGNTVDFLQIPYNIGWYVAT